MVLLSSVDQIVHMCKNLKSSSKVEQEETVDSGVLCEQPLRSRMCELLQRTLQSIDSAASDYYDNTTCDSTSDRSDIPVDKMTFMSKQNQIHEALSTRCDDHIAHEQSVLRMQA